MSLIFSTSTVFIARRITAFISFFLGGWVGGGGRYLGYFFGVVVICFIFREYFFLLTSK